MWPFRTKPEPTCNPAKCLLAIQAERDATTAANKRAEVFVALTQALVDSIEIVIKEKTQLQLEIAELRAHAPVRDAKTGRFVEREK